MFLGAWNLAFDIWCLRIGALSSFLADIALPVPLDRTFTYTVPADLGSLVARGKRVLVPFGSKYLTGIIVGFPSRTDVTGLKAIRDVFDATPTFSEEMLTLTKWIGEYYFAPWGEVLRAATPQGLSLESKQMVEAVPGMVEKALEATKKKAPKQHAVLRLLAAEGPIRADRIAARTNTKSVHALLVSMEAQGWIHIEEQVEHPKAKPRKEKFVELTDAGTSAASAEQSGLREKQQNVLEALRLASEPLAVKKLLKQAGVSTSMLATLAKNGLVRFIMREVLRASAYDNVEPAVPVTLNSHQQAALGRITAALMEGKYKTFLLHGVTGSGKTQVYIESIRAILPMGKTAIVLVPEISLTPQTVRRFKAHFGAQVAVMHSQMSVGERFDAWRQARDGQARIVIGPRSAVFAPLRNIGLIVVDEEHEGSYKQYDATPRYHARDVAIVRASQEKAVVVLGSATPSVESYYNATRGKYELLELPERVDAATMPIIDIVDMTRERRERFEALKKEVKQTGKEFPKRLPVTSISRLLEDQIRRRLERSEGVILLQNRRGFSHVVECFDCGYVERCDNCDVTLTFHATKKHLRCHYCGFVKKPPTVCPSCGSIEIRMHAFGTQQVQEELAGLFPTATLLRMDRDTTTRKGSHDRILGQFGEGRADILLGTQMVAKGLDFPRVTLVGVISADTQMLLPDFRAAEDTFQLLTQVSGRAGRSTLAGEVVIQTLQPEHYSLKHVVAHDFRGFYEEELAFRRQLDYPPFSRIVLLEFTGERETDVQHHARKFAEFLSHHNTQKAFVVLGPADAAILKIRNRFRKHVVIKDLKVHDPSGAVLRSAIQGSMKEYESSALAASKGVRIVVDVDPQGMM